MTALAIALVLCCAMVCGMRVYGLRRDERLALCMKDRSDLNGLAERVTALEARARTVSGEVEQLRAQVALRGAL